MGPARERGASITPAYEGWYQNDDGSFSMLIGYYNRNSKEALDIPVGPNNTIEPGRARPGPAHLLRDRAGSGACSSSRCRRTSASKIITWTIVANGETQSIPFTLNKGYPITPFKELGMGNQPPVLSFTRGRRQGHGAARRHGRAPSPARSKPAGGDHVWVEDPKGKERKAAGAARRRRWPPSRCTSIRGPGHGDLRHGARCPAPKQGEQVTANGDVQRARRVPAARAGQRRIG